MIACAFRPLQAAAFRRVPHRNIIKTYEPADSDSNVHLSMPLCDFDLFELLQRRGGRLAEKSAQPLLRQVLAAIQHCHSLSIYHRDIKPENVLMLLGTPLLADFGAAAFQEHITQPCATAQYACPQSVATAIRSAHASRFETAFSSSTGSDVCAYSAALSDVWSFGLLILVTVSGALPWRLAHTQDLAYSYWQRAVTASHDGFPIEACYGLMFAEDCISVSPSLLHLLCGMLRPAQEARFTLSQVLAHPWFN